MTDREMAIMASVAEQSSRKAVVEVLGEIAAEIEQEYNRLSSTRADETLELGECLGLKLSLKIIDRYKEGESE